MALGLGNTYDVSVKFLADLKNFVQGIEKGSKKIEEFGVRAKKAGASLTKNLTLPILAIGTAAINASLKMNRGMANIATLIPGATERVKELKGGIQDLSIEMGITTADMVGGTYEVISAFGDTADTMARLEANAKLAVGGFASVAEAVNFTSAATRGFGDISAEAIAKASDLGLLVVRLGKTSFPELSGSIGKVTGNAKALGITLEELMAMYATLTGVTGDTAKVTTQIDAAMRAFMKPTKEMTAAIKELGYAGSEALIGDKGLAGALRAVLATTDGTVEAVGELVESSEAFPLVFALSAAQADVFDDKLKQMNGSLGTTDEAVKAATEGIDAAGFSWRQFTVELGVMAENLGDELIPIFQKLLNDFIIPLIKKIADWIKGFSELEPWVQKLILGFVAFLALLGPMLTLIGNLIVVFKALAVTIITKVIPAFKGLTLATAGRGGLIAALVILAATAVGGAVKAKALKDEYKKTKEEFKKTREEIGKFEKKIGELNRTLDKHIEKGDEVGESYERLKKEILEMIDAFPELRKELGITVGAGGELYDANGNLIDSYEDLQGLLNEFSTLNLRQELYKAVVTTTETARKMLETYLGWQWAPWGFKVTLADVEAALALEREAKTLYAREMGKDMLTADEWRQQDLKRVRIWARDREEQILGLAAKWKDTIEIPKDWFKGATKELSDAALQWLLDVARYEREIYTEIQAIELPKPKLPAEAKPTPTERPPTEPPPIRDIEDALDKGRETLTDLQQLVQAADEYSKETLRQENLIAEKFEMGIYTKVEAWEKMVSLYEYAIDHMLDLASQMERLPGGKAEAFLYRNQAESWLAYLEEQRRFLDNLIESLKPIEEIPTQAGGRWLPGPAQRAELERTLGPLGITEFAMPGAKWPEADEVEGEAGDEIRGMFDSLNSALIDGAAELGRAITGGNIAEMLQNVFQMLGDAIAEDISTYIAAQIPGLGGGILGALGGGLISGLFSSIFGGGGGRSEAGMTESNPIFANITNWDQFFQFGMTLPASWILSGRSRDFDLDPHGRTVDGLRDERRTDMHYNH